MNYFLDQPFSLDPVEGTGSRPLYRTVGELTYHSDKFGTFTVPAGTETNLASVPLWVPRWIVDDNSAFIQKPSVLHDLLCAQRGHYEPTRRRLRDREVHAIFREGIRAEGGSALRAWICERAVILGTSWPDPI